MDKPKTKVVKSKSSNSAITTKSEPRKHNKKSRSNAEFQPLLLKKRGVYVEKKPTTISINERDISPVDENLPMQYDSDVMAARNIARVDMQDTKSDLLPNKPLLSPNFSRPIPRPGRKRFLASVLTILSQSTTGTQYPDHDDPDRFRRLERTKARLKRKKDEEIIQEDVISSSYMSRRKSKYRSRLNDDDSELEQLVVLQSTKEITHTPSNHSDKSNNFKDATSKDPETMKWADVLPNLVKKKLDVPTPEENKELPVISEKPRVKIVERDPSTLVAEVPKKDDKKFYNFFVDLLETTFNVYNVKTEFNPPAASSVNSSKVALEIDESVAKKLQNIKNKDPVSEDVTRKPSFKHFYCIKPDDKDIWDDEQLLEHFQPKSVKRSRTASPSKSMKKRRRLQSESFNYKKSKPIPLTNSLIIPKRALLKRDRKKNFINLLKEQLKMDDDAFDEPQNFFQALKVIARNKRRCQKSIHFKESKKSSEGDVHVCQFKRRRLLSASTKSSSKKSCYRPESEFIKSMRSFTRNSDITSTTKKRTTITITESSNEIPSQHSLEVFGFDYEPAPKKLPEVFPSFPPSASTSMQDYNINQTILMKDSDSGTSSAMPGRKQKVGKRGMKSLSGLEE